MKLAISVSFLILVTIIAAPAMADTLITWSLNGNMFTDNDTPLTGFFTWDATTETVTVFDISLPGGTGVLINGACCAPTSAAVPAFELSTEFGLFHSTAHVFTDPFNIEFDSDLLTVTEVATFPTFSLRIGTSEALLNGIGGTTIGASITEDYSQPAIDEKFSTFVVQYERIATFDPSGPCASLGTACLSTTALPGVPEPGTLLLLGSGLAGLMMWRRQFRGL